MNVMEKFNLSGKTAIVTGSSRGIGREAAAALAWAGANVAIVSRNQADLDKTAEAIAKETGAVIFPVAADVSKEDSVNEMVAKVAERFGTVDVLVNNAGFASDGMPAEELPLSMFRELFDTNVMSAFACSKACSKYMIPKRKGSIVNTASMSAFICNTPQTTTHYAVSKAALIALTRNLAAEWGKYNVRVNSISPGYHKTELLCTWEQMFPLWIPKVPMERLGIPDELAAAFLFFASDASSYTTGADLVMDGGYMLW